MRRLQFSPEAQNDLDNIYEYLEPRSLPAARKFRTDLLNYLRLLRLNPHMGPIVGEIYPDLRSLPLGRYIVLYRVDEQFIEIVRIPHSTSDWLRIYGDV